MYLVIGALLTPTVTWAAHWTFGWRSEWVVARDGRYVAGTTPKAIEWPHAVPADWPKSADGFQHTATFWADDAKYDYLTAHRVHVLDAPRFEPDVRELTKHSEGLPFRCLQSWREREFEFGALGRAARLHSSGEWAGNLPLAFPDSLPFVPLWPGFALNTIFYAALAWGLWQVPLAIRRSRRRRNGLCVRCGYDFTGLTVGSPCPECGTQPRADWPGLH